MNKVLNAKTHLKRSAAEVLLMALFGKRCQLEFERQDEVFEGVLYSSYGDLDWQCDATFDTHWVNAVEPNDDGSYTIHVRIPDDEYAEMVAESYEHTVEVFND